MNVQRTRRWDSSMTVRPRIKSTSRVEVNNPQPTQCGDPCPPSGPPAMGTRTLSVSSTSPPHASVLPAPTRGRLNATTCARTARLGVECMYSDILPMHTMLQRRRPWTDSRGSRRERDVRSLSAELLQKQQEVCGVCRVDGVAASALLVGVLPAIRAHETLSYH